MDVVTHVVVWLNALANAIGRIVLAPVAVLPGWVSATLIAAASGVLFLVVFKYTSNQRAIKRIRDDISANLLSLRLFNDSALVALRAQVRILLGACRLSTLAVVPILVMFVPASLLLGQMGLWYESRPLPVGKEAVVTLRLNGAADSAWPDVRLEPADFAEVTIGPLRVNSRREICWNILARREGYHGLRFRVNDDTIDKELALGDAFMRVSIRRPAWQWGDVLTHPSEAPFSPDGSVQSIDIQYPQRASWTSGAGTWIVYWFVGSMVSGFCFRRLLNVSI